MKSVMQKGYAKNTMNIIVAKLQKQRQEGMNGQKNIFKTLKEIRNGEFTKEIGGEKKEKTRKPEQREKNITLAQKSKNEQIFF
jgi:hypothetical protein